MTRIFPDAKDYKTINLRISPQQRTAIEAKLGFELLPGQRDQFQYFEMTGAGGKKIGVIIAASQKGEFGAIEFVFGLDTNMVIKDLYIQRSRERDQSFKERDFLSRFIGKRMTDAMALEKIPEADLTIGKSAVIKGLKKELIVLQELGAWISDN